MQTDPVGYADGLNWYDYVGDDPVDRDDPSGEDGATPPNGQPPPPPPPEVVVTAKHKPPSDHQTQYVGVTINFFVGMGASVSIGHYITWDNLSGKKVKSGGFVTLKAGAGLDAGVGADLDRKKGDASDPLNLSASGCFTFVCDGGVLAYANGDHAEDPSASAAPEQGVDHLKPKVDVGGNISAGGTSTF